MEIAITQNVEFLFADVLDRMRKKISGLKKTDFDYEERYLWGSKYGVLNSILEEKRADVERIVGEPLYPTYSMVFRVEKQGIFMPRTGTYTQDISVFVPIVLHDKANPVEVAYYEKDKFKYEWELREGDASIVSGFKIKRAMYPLTNIPKTKPCYFAKFNYIRQSDPCSELLRLDGYPDLYGEGPRPDRMTRSNPDYIDRMQKQLARNHPIYYPPDYTKTEEDFIKRCKKRGAKFSGIDIEQFDTQIDPNLFV